MRSMAQRFVCISAVLFLSNSHLNSQFPLTIQKNVVANVFIALNKKCWKKHTHTGNEYTVSHEKLVLKSKSKQFNELAEFSLLLALKAVGIRWVEEKTLLCLNSFLENSRKFPGKIWQLLWNLNKEISQHGTSHSLDERTFRLQLLYHTLFICAMLEKSVLQM